jgi:spore maturation protein CgeB
VFEAAGCASCVITDARAGVSTFFSPGQEILVASSPIEIVDHLRFTRPARAAAIGAAARRRVLAEHTYTARAAELESALSQLVGVRAA